jgi:hypothetical protein
MQPDQLLGEDTFSTQTQYTIRKWLENCSRNHPDCQGRADKGFIPTRLLDVGREDQIYVVDTNLDQIKEPYTTLSYC